MLVPFSRIQNHDCIGWNFDTAKYHRLPEVHSKKDILKYPVKPCSTELISFSRASCRGFKPWNNTKMNRLWQQNSFIQPGNSCAALWPWNGHINSKIFYWECENYAPWPWNIFFWSLVLSWNRFVLHILAHDVKLQKEPEANIE